MFDSVLLGYGFTKRLFQEIRTHFTISEPSRTYLDFNLFLYDFLSKPLHSAIWRNFDKLFDDSFDAAKLRISVRAELLDRIGEIQVLGFERWVSRNVFHETNKVSSDQKLFVYLIYNYWADCLHSSVFQRSAIQDYLSQVYRSVKDKYDVNRFFTTNYDTYFDDAGEIDHLHGRFILPNRNIGDMIHFLPWDNSSFEYPYLFGGGGVEKTSRLETIRKMKIEHYDLEFFFDDSLEIGRLLIFGLSFAKTEYLNDEFFAEFPKYKNDFHFISIDGHILKRLREMSDKGKVTDIVVSYYRDEELDYLKRLFSKAGLTRKTTFRSTEDINLICV